MFPTSRRGGDRAVPFLCRDKGTDFHVPMLWGYRRPNCRPLEFGGIGVGAGVGIIG